MCVHVCVWVKAVVSTVAMQYLVASVFVYTYNTCTIIAHKCLGMHVGTSFSAAVLMELAMVR